MLENILVYTLFYLVIILNILFIHLLILEYIK